MSTVQTTQESCYNDATDIYARIFPSKPSLVLSLTSREKNQLIYDTTLFDLIPHTSGDFCKGPDDPKLTFGNLMSSWAMAGENFYKESACNTATVGFPNSLNLAAGSMLGSAPYEHSLGATD